MATPQTALSGINSLVLVNGTLVGAQTDATLNLPADSVQVTTKQGFGWQESLPGVTSWSLDTGNLLKPNGGQPFLSNDQPDRTYLSVGGTNVPKLTSVGVTLTQEIERVSTHSGGLVQSLYLGQRGVSIDIDGLYLDPAASDSQIQTLLDARNNADRLDLAFGIDTLEIAGSFSLDDFSIEGAAEAAPISFSATFSSSGPSTKGGTDLDSSVMAAINAFFDQSAATAAFELQDAGGAIVGSTRFSGSGYFSDVSFTADTESPAELSATIEGDGAITTAEVA
jgi:predicted secreted protein